MMVRIALVDDDAACIRQLNEYIRAFSQEIGQSIEVSSFSDGDAFVSSYRSQFDIILMDVEMPLLDGMSTAELIRRQDPEVIIIFITNMAQYAIRGYAVDALDYVLKPVSYFSFSQRLGKAIRRIRKRERVFLTVPVKGGAMKLEVSDLHYIESQGHQLTYHAVSGVYTATSGTIQQAEEDLAEFPFFRCNKGYLVNLEHVEGVQDGCALVSGDRLPISRAKKAAFLEALTNYVSGVR